MRCLGTLYHSKETDEQEPATLLLSPSILNSMNVHEPSAPSDHYELLRAGAVLIIYLHLPSKLTLHKTTPHHTFRRGRYPPHGAQSRVPYLHHLRRLTAIRPRLLLCQRHGDDHHLKKMEIQPW